ncbi:hypothetical protein [Brevibacillus brevis]|uniref:hypothetical protein n=1 Tax=Brevibacillus brevis TaxID=1393 RepID=UPI0020A357C2|nr:hypothetical protein [Brevibacillus brevis]
MNSLDNLVINEGCSVGAIKLGMREEEVQQYIQSYKEKCLNPRISFHRNFRCEYDSEGRLIYIEVVNDLKRHFNCLFRDIDVFNTRASQLVKMIDILSPYDRNSAHGGFVYKFPELGLSFWRGNVLSEEDMEKDWFKEMDPEIQEDEMKNLYFETVSIYSISNSPKE